jgi:hypothetical protein
MKIQYCWRCKADVAMLDEDEFQTAQKLYSQGMSNVKVKPRTEQYSLLLNYYNDLTGANETEPNAIMHHRLTLYGTACDNCGKPYRTPSASFCASCGYKKA